MDRMTTPQHPAQGGTSVEWLKKQCNRYANGQCMTLACMRRGNHVVGTPNYDAATCEAHEAVLALNHLTTARAELEQAKATIYALHDKSATTASMAGVDETLWQSVLEQRDEAKAAVSDLQHQLEQARRLIHQVLHQRTGPMGLKVEDDLLRENEPLLRKCIEQTKDL